MSLCDRRRHPRFPFHSRGTLDLGILNCVGTIIDISLHGALFAPEMLIEVSIGCPCRLTVFHGRRPTFVVTEASVVYLHEEFIGVRFTDVGDDMASALKEMIELNLGRAQMMHREIPVLLKRLVD